jgi:hypothetical protein
MGVWGGGGELSVSHFLSVLYEVMIEKGQKNAPRKSHLNPSDKAFSLSFFVFLNP